MLLARFPHPDVLAAVGPHKGSVSLAFVVDEVTFIALAVFPGEHSVSVHFVLAPVS